MTKKKRKRAKKTCGHGGKRPGAGRPKTGRTTTGRCFTANKEEDIALRARAKREKTSIALVIKAAVRSHLGLGEEVE